MTMSAVEQIPALLTTADAARITRLTAWSIRKLVRRGVLPASRVGRTLLIKGTDLLAWIDASPSHKNGRALNSSGARRAPAFTKIPHEPADASK